MNYPHLIYRTAFAAIFLLSLVQPANTASLFRQEVGRSIFELELNELQYMPLSWYLPFGDHKIPRISPTSEWQIYSHLLSHAPRFLVLEGSVYPLPLAGIAVKKHQPDFYDRAEYQGFNLIQSATSSLFEEPWAGSIFFGNIVFFKPQKGAPKKEGAAKAFKQEPKQKKPPQDEIAGKGYSGLLLSYGSQHIKDNTLIQDHWLESEIKLIGVHSANRFYLNWSYRLGARYHFHPNIKSYLYLGIRRDRIDFQEFAFFSFMRNSRFAMRLSYAPKQEQFYDLRFILGKKFPFQDGELVPELSFGVIWQITSPYSGELASPEDEEWQFVISPNLHF